jgi:hypothetical protein
MREKVQLSDYGRSDWMRFGEVRIRQAAPVRIVGPVSSVILAWSTGNPSLKEVAARAAIPYLEWFAAGAIRAIPGPAA